MSHVTHDAFSILPATTDMSADVTSNVINIGETDDVGLQFAWTGSPVGNFTVECSIDGTTFTALSGVTVAAGGAAGNALLDLVGLCSKFLRLKYTHSSGSGALASALAEGKAH